MTEYSFFERLSKIFDVIFSSPFFVSLLIVLFLTIIILVINSKVVNKKPKMIASILYVLIAVLVIIRYGKYMLSINDSLVEKVFSAMYFPNLITYLCILLISVFVIIMSFMKKNNNIVTKCGNIFSFGLLWFMFVLILDVVRTNNIDVYDVKSIYSNESMSLHFNVYSTQIGATDENIAGGQASTYIFIVWMGILLMNYIVKKITSFIEKKNKPNDVINNTDDESFDDVKSISDEEFNNGFVSINNTKRNEEVNDILKH